MHGKITFFLALCWLSLLSTQAQIAPDDSLNSVSSTEAYWKHVKSLKKRGVTGTSGKLIRYDSPEAGLTGTPFAGKSDGDDVDISSGTHVFYDIDFKNLRILVRGGAHVSFYNCRFGQDKGALLGINPILKVQGSETKLILRFCDFEGPGDGQSAGSMLLANDILGDQVGDAAFIDIAYCRTYGHANDGWKIARGTSQYSYFGPTVGSQTAPTVYVDGQRYSKGEYVVTSECKSGGLLTSHVWRAKKNTSAKPKFCEKSSSEDWQYFNPHADFFHVFASEYQLEALGHYINSSISDPHPDDAQGGVHQIGINNAIRYDNGSESRWNVTPPIFRGFYVVRDQTRSSHAIDTGLPKPRKDSEFWRVEHLRTNAPPKGVITLKRSLFAFDTPRDLEGASPVQIVKHSKNADLHDNFHDVNKEYFARNGHSPEPSLIVRNAYNIKPVKFAPAFDNQMNKRINAVIFLVDGQRVAYLEKQNNGTLSTYVHEDYRLSEEKADGSYDLRHVNPDTVFHLVVWRGEANIKQTSSDKSGEVGPVSTIEITEFSRDKAPFDSGAGRKKNSARIPFKVVVQNAQNQPIPGAVVEGRIVTVTGQPVVPWKVIGTTNSKGEAQGNLYTQRHPEYLQREVRIRGNNQVTDQSENSFGVGHTIIIFAQSNLDQGFNKYHGKIPKPKSLSVGMVQHYYHDRDDGTKVANPRVGAKYIRRWDTGVSDSVDVTGWPTAFANALTESRPGEKFFIAWHVHAGTSYEDMVSNGGKRSPQVEKALADYFYADGQDRGGIAGGAWTHTPRRFGEFFDESHFPIFFKRTADGNPIDIPNLIPWGHKLDKELAADYWIGDWYDLNYLTYSFQDPHQFADAQDPSKSAYENTNRIRQAIRDLVKNPHAVDFNGDSAILPIYMGALNYAIGERKGDIFDDTIHPANNTPDGGMLFNALIAHGFLRAAGLTDWPEPVFDRHYRHPNGAWWEWWSTAGPITTTRRVREEKRPTPPAGYNASHWTEVVAFQIDKKPAKRVEIINGRVRIYPPTGKTFAPDDLSRISHGDGGASGHLNDGPDRIAELWKDIAIIDFDLPGIDGVALRAQIPPTKAGNATNNEYVDDTPATDPSPDTTRPYVKTVAATSTKITATYSEPIRQRGFGRVLIKTVPANQTVVDMEVINEGTTPGTIEYDGAKVIVRPASPLPAGEYAWRPHKNIFEDLAGNFTEDVINNYYHPFTIGASARTANDRDKIIMEEEMLSSSVYPNPNHGQFTVHIPEAEGNRVTISILSLSGQVLSEVQTQGARHIPMQTILPAGTYIVKIVSPEASYVERLIVE